MSAKVSTHLLPSFASPFSASGASAFVGRGFLVSNIAATHWRPDHRIRLSSLPSGSAGRPNATGALTARLPPFAGPYILWLAGAKSAFNTCTLVLGRNFHSSKGPVLLEL